MCEVLEVSKAGYYRWLGREPSLQALCNQDLLAFLKQSAKNQQSIPGYRKLWKDAVCAGYACSQNRVHRLLQKEGYRSASATKPGHHKATPGMPVLPNLLNRCFDVDEPNRVWVSDITQVRCQEGWLYVAVVIDLYARRVVGWSAGAVNSAELVLRALQQAWLLRQPDGSRLLFHSDQGSQYRSGDVLAWLTRREVTISMSRKGNCWDNACAESFFGHLKQEWLHRLELLERQDMIEELRYYIDDYYNPIRRHASLGLVSPAAYEMAA
jgi:putative transposase